MTFGGECLSKVQINTSVWCKHAMIVCWGNVVCFPKALLIFGWTEPVIIAQKKFRPLFP
jgi:hypothetical protein